ncbi:protein FAR-RED ELONGATED HYPOCOTYL 3-like [Cucumis melo var. makuwa]|uniref:Protein FAR-RED ELONGATED HYPOCOTYL 3-like n=1 Tax=Cucumis melo var. makuwa TaxID=1194695 RepID=A0A5A7UG79_CUCMM|nr:protein FAR-RED ELONGATED HYPOCOTYL 3-like [Cucumis melo var. makuwa]
MASLAIETVNGTKYQARHQGQQLSTLGCINDNEVQSGGKFWYYGRREQVIANGPCVLLVVFMGIGHYGFLLVHYIRAEHGLSISYHKAWHVRKAALDEIRGSPEDSYKMIPKFAYILKPNNPGYVVEYKVDADGRFLYFFMALSASISDWQHCHPVISINGTSLKDKYGGTLLSTSTPDTNDQIFSLAFWVVDFQNDFSWIWFATN